MQTQSGISGTNEKNTERPCGKKFNLTKQPHLATELTSCAAKTLENSLFIA